MRGLTYLCGPIANCTETEVSGWRYEAKQLLGIENCIDPTDRMWIKDESLLTPQQDKDVVEGDLTQIDKSVALLWNCWKPSYFSPAEAMYAKEQRKVVVVIGGRRAGPFPRWVATQSVDTVAEGCQYLRQRLRL